MKTTTDDNDGGVVYRKPERAIFAESDLNAFIISPSYKEIVSFVKILNASIRSQPCVEDDNGSISPAIRSIVELISTLKAGLKQFPPINQPMRFGNKAFRSWHSEFCQNKVDELHQGFLPPALHPAIVELKAYFSDSFGNPTRIDYGTGHETSFIVWLYGLHKIGFLSQNDLPNTVLVVFNQYLELMREMQVLYMLEPAGSHGVWGLDDYQCLAFYFGASQLIGQEALNILPDSIHDEAIVATHAQEFMYLRAVEFIKQVKAGSPFAETSPMLNDISGVQAWEKVNSGMLKLYEGEVLKKLPVIQHMVFGTILPCTWNHSNPPAAAAESTNASVRSNIHRETPDMSGIPTGRAPWAT